MHSKTDIETKKFVLFGEDKTLPEGRIIATKGEAGYQAQMLPPGIHFWRWVWQYSFEKSPFTIVSEGEIALIEAKDGLPWTFCHNDITNFVFRSTDREDLIMS